MCILVSPHIESAADLEEYLESESTMADIRELLTKGGSALFDVALKKLTA